MLNSTRLSTFSITCTISVIESFLITVSNIQNMKKRPNVKMLTHLRLNGVVTGRNLILDEWEIATDDIIADELLGKGEFGEVYKGVIRGPLKNPKISFVLRQAMAIPVAIKLLKRTSLCLLLNKHVHVV